MDEVFSDLEPRELEAHELAATCGNPNRVGGALVERGSERLYDEIELPLTAVLLLDTSESMGADHKEFNIVGVELG